MIIVFELSTCEQILYFDKQLYLRYVNLCGPLVYLCLHLIRPELPTMGRCLVKLNNGGRYQGHEPISRVQRSTTLTIEVDIKKKPTSKSN